MIGLTACPGPAAPTISSVLVTGPASNTIKLNTPTPFTAKALDSSGKEITGKAFTWTSSNPDVISIDAGGVATAKKFGTATVSAKTESTQGSSATVQTYGLEAAGGTMKSQGDARTGTAFIYKLRLPDGTEPTTAVPLTITGPAGWNDNKAFNDNYNPASSGWKIDYYFSTSLASVSGQYQITGTIGGEAYSASVSIDATNIMTPVASVTTSNASIAGVNATWPAATGALGYVAQVRDSSTGSIIAGANFRTDALSEQFKSLTLDTTKTYFVAVYASTAAWAPNDPPLPAVFNLAVAASSTFKPVP